MNLLNSNSEIIKLEVRAEGYHSGSKAYGEFYIPVDLFELTKNYLDGQTFYIYDLDGKHSEVVSNPLVYKKMTLKDLIEENSSKPGVIDISQDLDERIYIGMEEYLDESGQADKFTADLYSLSYEIRKLKKYFAEKVSRIIDADLELKDVEINGVFSDIVIPAGTEILVPNSHGDEYKIEIKHYKS